MQDAVVLLKTMGKTFRMMSVMIQQRMHQAGVHLSREQAMILKWLAENDGIIQNELAWITDRDKTTLTRILAKLENADYLERRSCTKDKRAKRVFITSEGEKIATQVEHVLSGVASDFLEKIPKENKSITVDTLHIIQNQLANE